MKNKNQCKVLRVNEIPDLYVITQCYLCGELDLTQGKQSQLVT